MNKETIKQNILHNQKNHLKALISSLQQKNSKGQGNNSSKQENLLYLFNTEDNRSSFGYPINYWPSGGPSYGVSAGALQNKTSSSKNKVTIKSKKSQKSQKSFD